MISSARCSAFAVALVACAPEPSTPVYEIDLAPADDWELSPYTGWTREHHEAYFGRLLLGFVANLSDGGGQTRYPGGEEHPASMEGTTRMLFAIGAWLSDPENPSTVRVDGLELDLVELAQSALLAGTDPASDDYWGALESGWDQRHVEAAIVAEFLVQTRSRVWDRLPATRQSQIMDWLEPSDDTLPGNWGLFLASRNLARMLLDHPAPAETLQLQIAQMEADYGGDGWYFDADPQRFDYYNSFVVHPSLDFAATHSADPELAERSAARARAYVSHLPFFFSAEGAPVMFGRSLAYNLALVTPIVVAEKRDYSPLHPGLSRRLVSGQLRFFVDGDVESTEGALDEDHVLRRGWGGDHPKLLEAYIRPGSQYYSTRVSQALAIPRAHPFWTSREQAAPADLGAFVHAVPAAKLVLIGSDDGRFVTLVNSGSNSEKAEGFGSYKRLVYSSSFAFNQASEGRFPYDGLVIPSRLERFDRPRSAPTDSLVGASAGFVAYRVLDEEGVDEREIRTLAFAWNEGVVRVSCVGDSDSTPVVTYEGGLAVPAPENGGAMSGAVPYPWLSLSSTRGSVILVGVDGFASAAEQPGFEGESGLNSVDEQARYPALVSASDRRCFVSFLRVSSDPLSLSDVQAELPSVLWEGDAARLDFADGTEVVADLSSEPSDRVWSLAGIEVSGVTRFAKVRADPVEFEVIGSAALADDAGQLAAVNGPNSRLACHLESTGLRCSTATGFEIRAPGTIESVVAQAAGSEPLDVTASTVVTEFSMHVDDSLVETMTAPSMATLLDLTVRLE